MQIPQPRLDKQHLLTSTAAAFLIAIVLGPASQSASLSVRTGEAIGMVIGAHILAAMLLVWSTYTRKYVPYAAVLVALLASV